MFNWWVTNGDMFASWNSCCYITPIWHPDRNITQHWGRKLVNQSWPYCSQSLRTMYHGTTCLKVMPGWWCFFERVNSFNTPIRVKSTHSLWLLSTLANLTYTFLGYALRPWPTARPGHDERVTIVPWSDESVCRRRYRCAHVASQGHAIWQVSTPAGWHGRTAGGPMHVEGKMNSTWCCNPQFKLSSRKPGELLLCVSQQDSMIVHGGHVAKRNRTFLIGLQACERLCTLLVAMQSSYDTYVHCNREGCTCFAVSVLSSLLLSWPTALQQGCLIWGCINLSLPLHWTYVCVPCRLCVSLTMQVAVG